MSQKTTGDKSRTRGKPLTQLLSTPSSPSKQSPIKNAAKPVNLTDDAEPGLGQIMARLDQLDLKVTEVNKSTIQAIADIASMAALLADSHRERDAVKRELQITTLGLDQMRESNKRLNMQINDLENRARCCNLKLDGKVEENPEDLRRYINEIITHLNADVNMTDILSVTRIGRKPPPRAQQQQQPTRHTDRPRTIMIVLRTVQVRNAIYFNRAKLNKTDKYRGIYLNDDVTQTTRKAREDYRSVAALARAAGSDVRVHGDGVVIDGRKYKHSDVLPERYSLAKAKTVNIEGEIFFHSEHSYLSNFHPSPITDGKTVYATAEHRLQAAKCALAKDNDRLKEVLQAHTPLEAKRAANQIPDSAEWRQHREAILKTTLNEKLNQNPHLINLLLSTGDVKLNEATSSAYYGIEATLHSREVRDKSYRGVNKLGLALMDIRSTLREEQTMNQH